MPGLRARALGAAGPIGGAAAAVVAWEIIPDRPLAVFGQGDVHAVIWPLIPVLFAAAIPASTAFATRTLERSAARAMWRLRLRSLVPVVLASAVVVAAAVGDHGYLVPARNTALLVGVAYLGVVVLPPTTNWVPVVMYPVVCWLVGTRSSGLHAAWALPLRPPGDQRATLVAVVVAAAGVGAFVKPVALPLRDGSYGE